MTGNEIRQKFLTYFEGKGHRLVPSFALIPFNDPTLFFVNAGMVPFKDVFTGREKKDFKTAVSSQKCMRVSGKHNDLENVGRTPRHHTFFEMLGNFSFGDYFKEEAIGYAWEFITEVVGIPQEPLWITIYKDDEEAFEIWHKKIGVSKDKIVRCGEKDNFWSMGETGPCGPCSEIHIDLPCYLDGKKSKGNPATNENDFMEIWNLVFMQFDRDSSGQKTPLPQPSIDTGMGLERLCTVLQKKRSNYDTDLFQPLIQGIAKITGKTYGQKAETDISLRVIADHIRAATFLISDGIQPSNEGRGYVLRRIMRRAIRHGRLLGMHQPFFYKVLPTLVQEMGEAYPDLKEHESFVEKVIRTEEERFLETLENGLTMIDAEITDLTKKKKKVFSGELAFKLYDTFGFPIDLTQLIAEERGLKVDRQAFEQKMEDQKDRARAAWKGSGEEAVDEIYHQLVRDKKCSCFIGYDSLSGESKITAIIADQKLTDKAHQDQTIEIFVHQTPFYGESGGQKGDQGIMKTQNGLVKVHDTQKPLEGILSHRGKVVQGVVKVGDVVTLTVDESRRRAIMLNHTATHILHASLREILGDHVKQAGSLVEAHRLRFDFSHFEALSPDDLEKIESRVNEIIQKNDPVKKEEMSFDEAQKRGALAFFGEKYGEKVRVISVGSYSKEFCGGTHLDASGEIGVFKIMSESSVASGVRRIEAITGMNALCEFQRLNHDQNKLAQLLKTTPEELLDRVQKMINRVKELEKEVVKLKSHMASGGGGSTDFMDQIEEVGGVPLLAMEAKIDDVKALRDFSDKVIHKMGRGIAVIVAEAQGKAQLIVRVSKDLSSKYQAGELIKELAPLVGGRGGGRPDMAQAGGDQPENLPEVFKKIRELLQ